MTGRFEVNVAVVLDAKTALMWEAEYQPACTWKAMHGYARRCRTGGFDDWRVPAIDELITLIDFERFGPASGFPGMPADWFWSSSSYAYGLNLAWFVSFNRGFVNLNDKSNAGGVRCVRRA